MQFEIKFTDEGQANYNDLAKNPAKSGVFKQVKKALGYMQTNLKHNSLHTHEYSSLTGQNGEKVFESYAQNKTPGAYRIFWHYGPNEMEETTKKATKPKIKNRVLTVVAITPHP